MRAISKLLATLNCCGVVLPADCRQLQTWRLVERPLKKMPEFYYLHSTASKLE
jgi:hypothetical protein